MTRTAAVCLVSALLCGCGTIETKANGAWGRSYSGTACSVRYVKRASSESRFAAPFAAIDVVLSAVADTLVWPVDLAAGPRAKDKKKLPDGCSWQ